MNIHVLELGERMEYEWNPCSVVQESTTESLEVPVWLLNSALVKNPSGSTLRIWWGHEHGERGDSVGPN